MDLRTDKDFKINNSCEYSTLRQEILSRIGWHQESTKTATTMSITVWGGSFALINYIFGKDASQDIFTISILALLFPMLMSLPIFMLYPLSIKIYENYASMCNISTYIAKFHEKPINENNGNFPSWETTHSALLSHFKVKKTKIAGTDHLETLNQHCDEVYFLSRISLALFVLFLVLNSYKVIKDMYLCNIININSLNDIVNIASLNDVVILSIFIINIIVLIIGAWLTWNVHKYSSYKRIVEISEITSKFWDSYKISSNQSE
jgi:hypothetical protein